MQLHDGFHPFHGRISRHFIDRDKVEMKPEDPYLSYHDVCLTKEDVDTLRNDWLTDNIISFYEEYLEQETLSKHPDAHIILLRPSMSQMLFLTSDPTSLKDALPSFEGVSHIFLPINDNVDPSRAEGGSHWSLLVVSTVDKTAFHYDSLSSSNKKEGMIVARQFGRLLGYELKYQDLVDAPQQGNAIDCGVFVCTTMKSLLVDRLLTKKKGEQVSMSMKGRGENPRKAREGMMRLIKGLREEGVRRRSESGSPASSRSPPRIE